MSGCVCFGWKSLPKMLFRKWGCLVGPENSIFRKMKSVDPKNVPLTTEMLLHFHFTFKGFPENERERERARARRRSSGIASSSSSPRSRSTARSRRRSRSREEGEIAIRRDRDLGSLRAVIAISDRDRAVIAIAIQIAIAPSIAMKDRDRAVSAVIAISDRDLGSRWRVCRTENISGIKDFFFLGCGLWLVFSDLCFPSSFPNTRKYFSENFLKCNQTHGNIFLFRKLAFSKNMYFLENVLQQPNTALVTLYFQTVT